MLLSEIALTLPDKKVFKMLVRESTIIWKRSWILILNIFRDLVFRMGNLKLVLLVKVLVIKKSGDIYIGKNVNLMCTGFVSFIFTCVVIIVIKVQRLFFHNVLDVV